MAFCNSSSPTRIPRAEAELANLPIRTAGMGYVGSPLRSESVSRSKASEATPRLFASAPFEPLAVRHRDVAASTGA